MTDDEAAGYIGLAIGVLTAHIDNETGDRLEAAIFVRDRVRAIEDEGGLYALLAGFLSLGSRLLVDLSYAQGGRASPGELLALLQQIALDRPT